MIKSLKYLLLMALFFMACKNDKSIHKDNDESLFYFDVVGNSNIDTVVVEDSKINKLNKSISIYFNGKKSLICEITPRVDSSFTKTSPKIENIYLEANNIQTNTKGLRVLSRNTDINPEYFFTDLYFNNQWIVKEVGFMDISSKNTFICKKAIQKSIRVFKNNVINPKAINQIYFNGTYCK